MIPALPFAGFGWTDAAALGYLGVVQIGLAYVFLVAGLSRVPAVEASLLLLIEPVLNPLWTWLVHREVPATGALAGGAVIVAALALRVWFADRGPASRR